ASRSSRCGSVSPPLRLRLCVTSGSRLAWKRLDIDDAGPRLDLTRQQREVLAQWKPFELARQVDVPESGMTREQKAVQLPGLALVPVGARVHVGHRIDLGMVVVEIGLERQPDVRGDRVHAGEHLKACVTARDTALLLGRTAGQLDVARLV